jgi:hypothetical protein
MPPDTTTLRARTIAEYLLTLGLDAPALTVLLSEVLAELLRAEALPAEHLRELPLRTMQLWLLARIQEGAPHAP